MSLYFVNFADGETLPSRDERRHIRSHALKGRGGRKRRAPTQQVARLASTKQPSTLFSCSSCSPGHNCHRAHFYELFQPSLDMRQPIYDDLALVTLPYQLTKAHRGALHECHRVIRQLLYPPAFCADTDGVIAVWMHFILEDEAYLQSALAYTASFADFFAGKPHLSPRALGHLAKAYALISTRLAGPEATSKSTIATVTSISLYQRLHRLQSLGRLHFEGLLKILSLRGGMATLAAEERAVALKPWGLDLEFALQDGQPVRFWGEHAPSSCFQMPSQLPYHSEASTNPVGIRELDPILSGIFIDVRHFASLLNGIRETTKVDPLDYSQHGQHLLYRLLWFAPVLQFEKLAPKEELLQLTLASFIITLLPEHGGQHKRFDLLSRRIHASFDKYAAAGVDDLSLCLWVLFVSGISVTDSSDDHWLLRSIGATLDGLDVHDWDGVREKLKHIMWMGALHDTPGRKLFEVAKQQRARTIN